MTNQKLWKTTGTDTRIRNVIQIAIDRGFDITSVTHQFEDSDPEVLLDSLNLLSNPYVWMVIFNHDFAKALWGEEYIGWDISDVYFKKHRIASQAWQFHLQQMVIADDPIEYLGENI